MRHLGQEREVAMEQAVLDKRVLRILFRYGKQVEGLLAGKCSQKMTSASWRSSISRLEAWGFVSLASSGHGNSRSVELTDEGRLWGEELACSANAETLAQVKESKEDAA
jgi:hypothetical protein